MSKPKVPTVDSHKRNNGVNRVGWSFVALLVQLAWLAFTWVFIRQYIPFAEAFIRLFAIALAVYIYSKDQTAAMRVPWVIFILIAPFMGTMLWLMYSRSGVSQKTRDEHLRVYQRLLPQFTASTEVIDEIAQIDPHVASQFHYLATTPYPTYRNKSLKFYDNTTDAFEAQFEDLATAEKFIFIEYHAVEDAQAFARMKAILFEKAAAGVDVRMLIDDVGSLGFIGNDFADLMAEHNIKFISFNRLVPLLRGFMNNRDHRKFTIIDGRVGYTGGYNLADEYFNINSPYGHWRDTGIRVEGPVIRSMTAMFLHMWNACQPTDADMRPFLDCTRQPLPSSPYDGYVSAFGYHPLLGEKTGENVYMNMLKSAVRRAWVTTPYLILSDEMRRELCLAAKRGIDVRIITPGIPDKKSVFMATRSYYPELLRSGVRIYEYTPGFCHSKQWLVDDELACVGTINMDFRSLYLHFEDAVLMYRCSAIRDIEKDFEETFPQCSEVHYRPEAETGIRRVGYSLARLVAPLI